MKKVGHGAPDDNAGATGTKDEALAIIRRVTGVSEHNANKLLKNLSIVLAPIIRCMNGDNGFCLEDWQRPGGPCMASNDGGGAFRKLTNIDILDNVVTDASVMGERVPWTPEMLRAFEQDIVDEFNAGHIRAPVHLSGGNEERIIEIFRDVQPDDWVATQWRSHYHCLLHGVAPERLRADIMAGKSITLTYPEHRIISSAIVGGILPIAVGIAWSIKRAGGTNKVWAFVGDMTAHTGIFHECYRYADGHRLPITFVVEDNGISVCTPTLNAWGQDETCDGMMIDDYAYELPWPHAGAGKRIQF